MKESDFYLPYNPELVTKARELRKNMTVAEKKLWYGYLRGFKYKVLRQRPIAFFIVDFYCAALKLVIEVDGDSHFTEQGKAYDARRTEILKGYGLKVIRFTNDEVLHNFEAVCQRIESSIPPSPQGCFILQNWGFNLSSQLSGLRKKSSLIVDQLYIMFLKT